MALKQPLRNALSAATADVLSRLLGFAATAYLARVLGASSFGVMSIGLSVLSYVAIFSSPGLQVLGTREVAARTGSTHILANDVTSLRLFLATLCVLLTGLLGVALYGNTPEWTLVFLFACSALPIALSLDWYFQGKEEIVAISVSKVLMYCVYVGFVWVLVATDRDIIWAAVAYFVANLASALWLLARFRRMIGMVELHWNPREWWMLLKESLPLGISSLLSQSIVNLPILIVGLLLTTRDTGFFNASMKLIFFVLMIDRVFYILYFPVISRYRRSGDEQFSRLVALGLKVVVLVSIPVLVLGFGFADIIMRFVYGPEYHSAVIIFQYSLPFVVFTTMNTVLMCVYYSDNRQKEYLTLLLIGTCVLVLLCVVLSIGWGTTGTAGALSIGEAVMSLIFIMKMKPTATVNVVRVLWRLVVSGIVMSYAAYATRNLFLPLSVIASCLSFGMTVLAFGGLKRDDFQFLRERFV